MTPLIRNVLVRTALLAASVAAPALPAFAGDPAEGRRIAQTRCATCHGIDGIAKMPIAPHLAGESETYLVTQLKAFRSGKRVNEMMSIVAEGLGDTEIDDVASWYASIQISVTVPD